MTSSDPQPTAIPAATSGRACRRWDGAQYCGETEDTHLYVNGPRCPRHTPAAIAGEPEPTGQYCAPARHYCVAAGVPCAAWTELQQDEAAVTDPGTPPNPALFDVPDAPGPALPAPKESDTVKRTRRQAAMLAAGIHPLSAVLSVKLRLHPEAAPYGDSKAEGRRCGNCRFREQTGNRGRTYPKCLIGWDGDPRREPPRASHGAATDCRAWWPACVDHQPVGPGEVRA
jgi:hypothetical protein